jgi:hypothetical protein
MIAAHLEQMQQQLEHIGRLLRIVRAEWRFLFVLRNESDFNVAQPELNLLSREHRSRGRGLTRIRRAPRDTPKVVKPFTNKFVRPVHAPPP